MAHKPRLTGAERARVAADLATRYQKGATLQELEAATGRSYTLVRRLVMEGGAQLRPGGPRRT